MHISLNVFIGTEERNSAVFTENEFKRREATVSKEDVGFAALAGLLSKTYVLSFVSGSQTKTFRGAERSSRHRKTSFVQRVEKAEIKTWSRDFVSKLCSIDAEYRIKLGVAFPTCVMCVHTVQVQTSKKLVSGFKRPVNRKTKILKKPQYPSRQLYARIFH